jgi:hypothetical protein
LSLSPMTRGNNVLISGKIVILFYTILHVYIYIYQRKQNLYCKKKKRDVWYYKEKSKLI